MTSRSAFKYALYGAILALSGCVSDQAVVDRAAVDDGAPDVKKIITDLTRNDNAINTFRAGGGVELESPNLEATQKFSTGSVRFQRPADLFVQGNHRITNTPLFKLRARGKEFLIEVPANYTQNYISLEGEWFESVPFSVSPADIAREMFLPEEWEDLSSRDVRVAEYDADSERATLLIGPRRAPRRRVDVAHINPDDPAWVIVRNIRYGDDGETLAETALSDYVVVDGIRIPTRLVAEFPTEQTRMALSLRNIRVNVPLEPADFDVRGRAVELGLLSPADAAKH